jgi:DNA-binding response OmpR family regulator
VRVSRILIVEDDAKTSAAIELYLRDAGYETAVAANGRRAVELARAKKPDLVVLDRMLPELDGMEVCRVLRAESAVPIIMVTARATLDDRLEGLDQGADDYVTKPFSPRELVSRVRAVLRRAEPREESDGESQLVRAGSLEVDPLRHEVRVAGAGIFVTAAELRILLALARAPGRTFTREELVRRAFGDSHEALDRTIDVHIRNIRRKIEDDPSQPRRIVTVFGVGYKLAD